jgi:alpha-methylacyl-CoA racemase
MAQALTGIKVLDLSRMPPGDFCTMYLGDMGAEVVRVEAPPAAGSRARGFSLRQRSEESGREEVFYALNRNKKSIALNLKEWSGRQVLYRLAQWADVMVEGFRPGAAKRLGIDYDTIHKLNPSIVYCSISGYGQDGPYREMPGHDANYLSFAGVLGLVGVPDGTPILPLNLVADYAGGSLHAVIGILAALLARQATGRGQYVDISMTDGALSLLTAFVSRYLATGVIPQRGKSVLNGIQPCYSIYQTKDGRYISIGCIEPWFWENICRYAGREDFISCQFDEGQKREEMRQFFCQFFLTKTRDEWFDLLRDKEIPVAKVYDINEALTDPQVLHRQMAVELKHPEYGTVKQVGVAIKFSDTPGQIKSLAPVQGQHTEEILRNLGYSAQEITQMRSSGIAV